MAARFVREQDSSFWQLGREVIPLPCEAIGTASDHIMWRCCDIVLNQVPQIPKVLSIQDSCDKHSIIAH